MAARYFVTSTKARWADRAGTAGLTLFFFALMVLGHSLVSDAEPVKITLAAPQACMAEFVDGVGNKTWKAGHIVDDTNLVASNLHCPVEGGC